MSNTSDSTCDSSNISLSSWIFDWGKIVFGFLVVVSAPLLYIHGVIYYYSYLDVFGLEPALFAIDKETTFVKGYFVALQMCVSLVLYLIIFVIVTFFAAFLVDQLISKGKWNEKPIFFSLTSKGLAVFGIASATVALGIILLAMSMLTSHKIGTSQANQDAEKFRTKDKAVGTSRISATIAQETGDRVLDGFKILCSEKWCAFYVDSKVEVHPVEKLRWLKSAAPESRQ